MVGKNLTRIPVLVEVMFESRGGSADNKQAINRKC